MVPVKIEMRKIQDMQCRNPRGAYLGDKGGHGMEMGRDGSYRIGGPHASPRWPRPE